jgi:hypothetical protein
LGGNLQIRGLVVWCGGGVVVVVVVCARVCVRVRVCVCVWWRGGVRQRNNAPSRSPNPANAYKQANNMIEIAYLQSAKARAWTCRCGVCCEGKPMLEQLS